MLNWVKLVALITSINFWAAFALAETPEAQRLRLEREYRDIPRITAEQAYILFKTGKILIADANHPNRFKEQHCYGAVNIWRDIASRARIKVKPGVVIGVY